MPIYAPTLPPKPDLASGQHPIRVLMRFDLRRILTQKLGIFFIVVFTLILIVELALLYFNYLVKTSAALQGVAGIARQIMTQGAAYQAGHLDNFVLTPLWFLLATVGAGLVARDSLYRIRPLIYAHPLRHQDYLLAKGAFAALLPFMLMLPFILIPWLMSLLIAGSAGPVWPTLPLHLLPAAAIIALIMGAVTLGASAMAGGVKAAFGWVLGIVLGSFAIGSILAGILGSPNFWALSPAVLVTAWPQILCGVEHPVLPIGPCLAGTIAHLGLWIFIAHSRTRPSEATS
jgi:hypothetical protein